ncbi:hypothetical protein Y032_0070g443 [Ancylostoma ceylanicum]|uniref:Uncharacterized protein n=1 Tax=Ancylostoma ceylanicum TaxID=53326 RepID=A0A016TXW2_9BILA|nr:hypothetical protein Y032_0070g443 [Ancylostoma ceylanicum]
MRIALRHHTRKFQCCIIRGSTENDGVSCASKGPTTAPLIGSATKRWLMPADVSAALSSQVFSVYFGLSCGRTARHDASWRSIPICCLLERCQQYSTRHATWCTRYVRANYEAAKVNADGVEDIVADMLKKAQANIRRKVRGDRQLYFEK